MTFLEELVRAVVWFHPAVWLILPRISLSREQIVDRDTVRLTGWIKYPGTYAIEPGMRLSHLLRDGEVLRPDSYLPRAVIKRRLPDGTHQLIPVNLNRLLGTNDRFGALGESDGLLATAASCELYRTFMAGRSAEAGRLQERIGPLHKKVVAGTGVPGVKHGLDLLGLAGGPPRPPLLPPTDRERGEVAKALERAGLATGSPQSV